MFRAGEGDAPSFLDSSRCPYFNRHIGVNRPLKSRLRRSEGLPESAAAATTSRVT